MLNLTGDVATLFKLSKYCETFSWRVGQAQLSAQSVKCFLCLFTWFLVERRAAPARADITMKIIPPTKLQNRKIDSTVTPMAWTNTHRHISQTECVHTYYKPWTKLKCVTPSDDYNICAIMHGGRKCSLLRLFIYMSVFILIFHFPQWTILLHKATSLVCQSK